MENNKPCRFSNGRVLDINGDANSKTASNINDK